MAETQEIIDEINRGIVEKLQEEERDREKEREQRLREAALEISAKLVEGKKTKR
jgi:hypothetical protein